MSKSKLAPWTSWALALVTLVLVVTAIVLWLIGVSYPKSGWYILIIYGPFFFLWWLDGILRLDREIRYQRHMLRGEVQRAVRAELDKRERVQVKDPLAYRRRVVDTEAEEKAPLLVQVGGRSYRKKNK